jgi:SPP1 family predicted phage head-tail adaptor
MTRYRINPGEFRHIITFQKKSGEQNDYGEVIDQWEDITTTRAAIYPISGKEFFAAEKINSEVTHKVNLRFSPSITTDLRVKFGERFFRIESAINFQEKNSILQLLCKELI